MTYRVLTIAREYASGGADLAHAVAAHLGWNVLDAGLVTRVAEVAQVDPKLVRQYDERVDSWLYRVARRALWHGAFEAVGGMGETKVLDAETMATLASNLIREAHTKGNCVMVGRGAQCVLEGAADVFHVYVYAPPAEKLARLRERLPGTPDPAALMQRMDRCRLDYIRQYFGRDRTDPHLYHLMVNSTIGLYAATQVVLGAMERG